MAGDLSQDFAPEPGEFAFLGKTHGICKWSSAVLLCRNTLQFQEGLELQNGSLLVARSNVFTASTIHGSDFGQSGAIDYHELKRNVGRAADVYISKCNNAPFGESSIRLFKGSKNYLAKKFKSGRCHLTTFFKGSEKEKKKTDG